MDATRQNEYIAANIHVLSQGAALARSLTDQTYCNHAFGGRSAIGVHLRHALDFYEKFLDGLAAGRIDYDRRPRDKRVEQDRAYACERCDEFIARLRSVTELDAEVWVKVDVGDNADDPSAYSRSTVRRELQALIGHTIHHYALITYLLRAQDQEPDADFGVAPSTLDYWQRQQLGAA